MKEYKVALFVGRFQPFHNGHLFSLNKCLELADTVMVGIGSSQESGTENNPWDFETRKKMVESLKESLKVVAIPDVYDDQKWGEQILDVIKNANCEPGEVVGVGNNEWTNRILKSVGIEVYESGLYNRDELEGIKIRKLIKENDPSWKSRVPENVLKSLEKYVK
ncbi:MAG: adenylyltransferase/cytidyltransferase family protein [bacterium]